GSCRVRFAVRRDSGTTFDAAVTVTNTGADRLTDWRLQFAFPGGQRIVADHAGGAGTLVGQIDRAVTVRPAGRRPLDSGDSAELAIRGRYTDANPLPRAFTVDGRACAATVSTMRRPAGDAATTAATTGPGGPAKKSS